MSNMSYCRFRNTLPDLRDCEDGLSEIASLGELSAEEARAARRLIDVCAQITADYGYMLNDEEEAA